jgi:hypothetical protein
MSNHDFAIIKVGIAGTRTNTDGIVFPECDAVDVWDPRSDAPQYDACAALATTHSPAWDGFLCPGHAAALGECGPLVW